MQDFHDAKRKTCPVNRQPPAQTPLSPKSINPELLNPVTLKSLWLGFGVLVELSSKEYSRLRCGLLSLEHIQNDLYNLFHAARHVRIIGATDLGWRVQSAPRPNSHYEGPVLKPIKHLIRS